MSKWIQYWKLILNVDKGIQMKRETWIKEERAK